MTIPTIRRPECSIINWFIFILLSPLLAIALKPHKYQVSLRGHHFHHWTAGYPNKGTHLINMSEIARTQKLGVSRWRATSCACNYKLRELPMRGTKGPGMPRDLPGREYIACISSGIKKGNFFSQSGIFIVLFFSDWRENWGTCWQCVFAKTRWCVNDF